MQSFGKIIKELRTKRDLTLDELADEVNRKFGTAINKGMISKWENEISEPKLETVRYLASFFNVSLDYLIGLGNQQEPETIAAHHDGDVWSEAELAEIEAFKQFVKSKRKE